MPDHARGSAVRVEVGKIVQRASGHGRTHVVSACREEHSLWVEISGPKGGSPWTMTSELARELAAYLIDAAGRVEAMR